MVTRLQLKQICTSESPVNIGDRRIENHLRTQEHCHDFHELFIVREGVVRHHINGITEDLTSGSICLISPDDVHFFERHSSCAFAHFTNVAFESNVYLDTRRFLSISPVGLSPSFSPVLHNVNKNNLALLDERIMNLRMGSRLDFSGKSTQLRLLLGEVFALFADARKEQCSDFTRGVPVWLTSAIQKMQEQENYVAGLWRFIDLCGRSQEYVNRSIRKWYATTPSQLVNQLRLGESARLITDTDMTIYRVLLACGFNNPSHFVSLFRQRFGCSPREFRRKNRSVTDPGD